MLRIGSIVLRVDDLQRQTEFWQAALGYIRRDDGTSDDFSCSAPPTARARTSRSIGFPRLCRSLRASTSTCTPKLAGGGRPAAGPRRVRGHLGQGPPDADYVILADPEGNRFCVVDVTR